METIAEKPKAVIHLLGLGCGNSADLTLKTVELLQSGLPVFLRTVNHPTVSWLREQGVVFTSFDSFYQEAENFTSLYQDIATKIISEAVKLGELIYGVPGHPLVAEQVSQLLLAEEKAPTGSPIEVRVYSAVSAIEGITTALGIDPAQGLIIQDALAYKEVAGDMPQLLLQVYSPLVAADLKLTLMASYPDDTPVTLVRAAGIPQEETIVNLPLHELDHIPWIDHLTSIYIPGGNLRVPAVVALDPLVAVMEQLRGPEGCPWDQEQDHFSLRPYCIEEAWEVVTAIEGGVSRELVDELGDLLLQIAFHACIAAETGEFDLADVVTAICDKMIRRHPHVFGELHFDSSAQVLQSWEQIKQAERAEVAQEWQPLLQGVGEGMPALSRARKIQEKVAGVGFDWRDASGPAAKVREELMELDAALVANDPIRGEQEFGDLLFSLVNWSRHVHIDPELALLGSCREFCERFFKMEKESLTSGENLVDKTLSELDALWERAKKR
ncbi:MAG: nucleoside triphosphate pyrophosphohydrolase [Symbiobacteriaceae bacterium]|nr:nucleoside triphosphate pyrophosphohydrolase [Symbiobacteriaceae bacterium]